MINSSHWHTTPHWPRGLSRLRAAAYAGVTPQAFDRMVTSEEMPKPKMIGGVRRWDKLAVDRAFDAIFNTQTDSAGEEIFEFEAGPPISEWPIATRPLPQLQERALLHMYEHRAGQFFRADGCGPKTYAALAELGLIERIGQIEGGRTPNYRLTKIGMKKAERSLRR